MVQEEMARVPTEETGIEVLSWSDCYWFLTPIRFSVFVDEQHVPPEMELDEYDDEALHAVLRVDHQVIGTARLFQENCESSQFVIGRLCLLKDFRGKGYGQLVMLRMLFEANVRGASSCLIHAQKSAQGLYQAIGFEVCSLPFMEAGIEHIMMRYFFSNGVVKNPQ
jgi:predicted GNAT family N-acyltransferase